MTHPTWELAVDEAALILTPCPGTKGVSLETSLRQLKAQGVAALVTAINNSEMQEKGVLALGEMTQALDMQWFHLPIEDDCAPDADFASQWLTIGPQLQSLLDNKQKIALHCMGGSGRTGLLAAHLLLDRGWDIKTIIERVQALRPGAFTKPIQCDYIQAVAQSA